MDGQRVGMPPWSESERTSLALLAESSSFRWALWTETEKEAYARSRAAYWVPRDVLICSRGETTPEPQLRLELPPGRNLEQSTVILQGGSGFCAGQTGESNHHSYVFRALGDGTNLGTPSGMQCCFRFTVFLGRGSSRGFHVAFPTVIALTPQVREPV